MNEKRRRFRDMLRREGMIVAPGAPDALTARIVQEAGFEACYMGGNGAVASMLGVPDIGLATFSEMSERARNVAACIDLPLICDADTGYGNVNNVVRTVRALEQAGVAGIHLEDQVTPKRCGAMDGLRLVSIEESAAKISAAAQMRRDPDFVIIARTDSRAVMDLEESIRRVKAFEAAGADMVYVEMLRSLDEVRAVVRSVEVPVVYDVLETTGIEPPTNRELEAAGVKMAIYSMSATLLVAGTMRRFMAELKTSGTTRHKTDDMLALHDYEKLLGVEEQSAFQSRFGAF